MAKQPRKRPAVTCDGLGNLNNGAARIAIDHALGLLAKDLEERGHDEKPREVTIKLTGQKKEGLVVVDVQAAIKFPAYRTGLTACRITVAENGQVMLEYQPDNADNPDQPSMYDPDQE